jgi:hypothetical protein
VRALRAAPAVPLNVSLPSAARSQVQAAMVLLCMIGAAGVSAGSADVRVMVSQQGVWPWQWKAFSHPELLVGLLWFVVWGSRWTHWTTRVPLAWLGATVFLGGHAAPMLDTPWLALALGAVLTLGKTAVLAWVWPRAQALVELRGGLATLGACVGVLCATGAWLLVDDARGLEQLLGRTLLLSVVAGSGVAWWQARQAYVRVRPVRLAPQP